MQYLGHSYTEKKKKKKRSFFILNSNITRYLLFICLLYIWQFSFIWEHLLTYLSVLTPYHRLTRWRIVRVSIHIPTGNLGSRDDMKVSYILEDLVSENLPNTLHICSIIPEILVDG